VAVFNGGAQPKKNRDSINNGQVEDRENIPAFWSSWKESYCKKDQHAKDVQLNLNSLNSSNILKDLSQRQKQLKEAASVAKKMNMQNR
jgi:hypothetical protein